MSVIYNFYEKQKTFSPFWIQFIVLKALPESSRVVRVMSNTPVLIREGASVFSCGTNATKSDSQTVRKLFTSVGMCEEIPEVLIDAVTALSGSGPAYVSLIKINYKSIL